MKWKPFLALLALLLVLGLGIAIFKKIRKTNAPDSRAGSRPSVAEFSLHDDEIKTLKLQAESGNGEAAYKLALYYTFTMNDPSTGVYWMSKAAASGHTGAKKGLDVIANRPR